MSNITEKELMELKKQINEMRDKIIQAQATYQEICKNIENYKTELASMGVDVENIEQFIKEKENEIEKLYQETIQIVSRWTQYQNQ